MTASCSARRWTRSASSRRKSRLIGVGRGGDRGAGDGRIAGDHPAVLYPGRYRRRHRLQHRGVRGHCTRRPARLADARGADRGIGARLEGIRARSRARPQRQLHRHLLDREHRPDGGPYRRLGDGRPGADPDRQGIPADAQRRDRGIARDRRRYRRLERAVRRQSGRWAPRHHRDEPAGVALLGAGVEGDRLPDRQGRRQARGRLHARRARQRDHRRHPGLVRADDRLRRHEDPALYVREIPGCRAAALDLDEIGRRMHGDRPQLRREHAEGAALDGYRARRLRRGGDRRGRDRPDRSREAVMAALARTVARPAAADRCRPTAHAKPDHRKEIHAACRFDCRGSWRRIREIVARRGDGCSATG